MPQHRGSGPSSVEQARETLGRRLRELRKQAGLTGRQLAESLAWPPSKVSKLENGRQTPTDEDIRGWARVTASDDETPALLASLHTLEEQHAEWRRVLRTGLLAHQTELAEQDKRTRLYRSFEPAVVPGLLQTPEYARAIFSVAMQFVAIPNDLDSAVTQRMRRQEILYRQDKRFHFIVTEAALRNRLCPPEVLLGQLDRIMALTSLRTVRLGVLDQRVRHAVDPRHGFMMYNAELVRVETFSAELNLRQPHEIEQYARVFERLSATASYDRAAREIVSRIVAELDAET